MPCHIYDPFEGHLYCWCGMPDWLLMKTANTITAWVIVVPFVEIRNLLFLFHYESERLPFASSANVPTSHDWCKGNNNRGGSPTMNPIGQIISCCFVFVSCFSHYGTFLPVSCSNSIRIQHLQVVLLEHGWQYCMNMCALDNVINILEKGKFTTISWCTRTLILKNMRMTIFHNVTSQRLRDGIKFYGSDIIIHMWWNEMVVLY